MSEVTEITAAHGPKVFVYGTLKKGHGNHRLLRNSEFLGRAVVHGQWQMADLGAFPAVVDAASVGPVFGEVYLIDAEVFASLDLLEGYPTFYTRTKVGTPYGRAWMYHLNPNGHSSNYEHDIMELPVWRPTVEERDWARTVMNGG
jgi:gamma-glutamylcyclotransferase (GGCT)/AIG2-like uncharacterized protein YtfP